MRRRSGLACFIALVVSLASPAAADDQDPALTPYEPIYAVAGTRGPTTVKLQFSFKFRIFNPQGSAGRRRPWVTRLQFGFSQISLWDVDSTSSPFLDTSYKPSLFYLHDQVWISTSGATRVGVRTGIEHESNGKDGDASRSLNIAYVEPIFTFGDSESYHWRVAPRLYSYIGDLSDNPDIADYRGYVDLKIRWGRSDGWILDLLLRRGTEKHHGSVQFDASYPLSDAPYRTFEFLAHVQYFNGWGETLINYDFKGPAQIRVGLMILR